MAPKNQILKKSFTHLAKQSSSLRHTVERNLDVIRRIGIFPSIEERELFFEVPVSSKEVVHKMVGHEPFVLIHPTSRWQFKCLPIERMKELVQNLLDQGKRVVLSSGPDAQEKKMVDAIGSGFPVLNLGGALSLQELGALIDASELLICVDSLAFHMANALKKRVIVFFGPTSEITWGPWRNPHARVVTSSMSCRPCYQDGCGGSKVSDCLANLSIDKYGLARISHTSG
jgi:heptosyltransferase-3